MTGFRTWKLIKHLWVLTSVCLSVCKVVEWTIAVSCKEWSYIQWYPLGKWKIVNLMQHFMWGRCHELQSYMPVCVSGDGLAMGFQALAQSTICSFHLKYSLLSLMVNPHPSLYLHIFIPNFWIQHTSVHTLYEEVTLKYFKMFWTQAYNFTSK
jgi:hypothetical protein